MLTLGVNVEYHLHCSGNDIRKKHAANVFV